MNKKEAWKYYKNWMKEKTFSPALKSEIKITRLAWDHVVRGNKYKSRSYKDQNVRLNLLKDVKHLIKTQKEATMKQSEGFQYHEITNRKFKKQAIRAVIRVDKNGAKVLYSWMKE